MISTRRNMAAFQNKAWKDGRPLWLFNEVLCFKFTEQSKLMDICSTLMQMEQAWLGIYICLSLEGDCKESVGLRTKSVPMKPGILMDFTLFVSQWFSFPLVINLKDIKGGIQVDCMDFCVLFLQAPSSENYVHNCVIGRSPEYHILRKLTFGRGMQK